MRPRPGCCYGSLEEMSESASRAPEVHIRTALRGILGHPWRTLAPSWSWKAAGLSAMLRAATFFATNLRAGRHKALDAMAVEAVFAIVAAGILGSVAQHLRCARPLWATALVVWLGMPAAMLLAQAGVHHVAGTQYMGTGLVVSFCYAAIASSFSWYAMSRGALLGGSVSTGVLEDLRVLPGIVMDYVLAVPRAVWRGTRKGSS